MGRKTIVVESYLPVLLVPIVSIHSSQLTTNHVVENEQKKQ